MKKISYIELNNYEISEFISLVKPNTFLEDSILFYKNHIPIVAYLIVDGTIEMNTSRKEHLVYGPSTIIAFDELLHHKRAAFQATAKKNSIIAYFDKSTLQHLPTHLKKIIFSTEREKTI